MHDDLVDVSPLLAPSGRVSRGLHMLRSRLKNQIPQGPFTHLMFCTARVIECHDVQQVGRSDFAVLVLERDWNIRLLAKSRGPKFRLK